MLPDYALFALSVPHHDELQTRVGELVRNCVTSNTRPLIVEAGTGTGNTTRSILSQCPSVRMVSVDHDSGMLDEARRQSMMFASRVEFICADIVDFLARQPNRSINVFVSAYTIHNLTYEMRERLAAELGRTVAYGGHFINADKIAQDDVWRHSLDLKEQIEAFSVYDQIGRSDLRDFWTQHYLADDLYKLSASDHIATLRGKGFEGLEVIWRHRMEAILTGRMIAV